MRFGLPFRGLPRKASHSIQSTASDRMDAVIACSRIARNLADDAEIAAIWAHKDTKKLLEVCKAKEVEYGKPHLLSASMLLTSLDLTLKNKQSKE